MRIASSAVLRLGTLSRYTLTEVNSTNERNFTVFSVLIAAYCSSVLTPLQDLRRSHVQDYK
jgi:hypothetical protein